MQRAQIKIMNRNFQTIYLYYSKLFCLLFLLLFLTETSVAQTKKPFSVPCGKALQIGAAQVEILHEKEMKRRTKGATDSGTESDATTGALKNYIGCRRADNAAKLKTFAAADTKAEVKRQQTAAKKLAQARFGNLIFGVSWDETGADSINYPMTLHAVALVEDYAGALIYSYSQDVEPNANGARLEAESDGKTIVALLKKMEAREFDDAADAATYKNKLTAFKVAVNRFLQENSDRVDTEKAITANFIVNLIKLGSWKN